MTARTNKSDNNMISDLHGGDSAANSFYNSGTFVTVHSRKRAAPSAIRIRNVTVANSNSRKLYFHLTRTSVGERHFFYNKRLTKFATNGCFHNG
jgi:hypothetical protein